MPDPLVCICGNHKRHDQPVRDICRSQQDDHEPEDAPRIPRAFDDPPANNRREGAD